MAKTEEEIRTWAEEYAKSHGWVLHPDEKHTKTVIKGLSRNSEKYGEMYCPCRIRSGDPEKDKRIICPCVFHQDEMAQAGHCTCNFFYDLEFF